MEYTKIVKEYILHIGKEAVFTDDLPVKWSCLGVRIDRRSSVLKFVFLSSEKGIEPSEVVANVDVTAEFVTTKKSWWHSALTNGQVIECREWNPEVTVSLNTEYLTNWVFTDRVKITFTVFIPKAKVMLLSGYDFTDKNEANDKVLVVGEQKFHVNKTILSEYSAFFNSLFNNKSFEEAEKQEIELKDLEAEEFKTLLEVIHPTNTSVNAENVEFLWKLSDRFGIISVATMCESFICNLEGKQTGNFSLSNRLKMAQLYNSEKLMAIVMEQIDKI